MKLLKMIRKIARKTVQKMKKFAQGVVRKIIYPLHCHRMRRKYGRIDDLTILSNFCVAGECYNVLGSQFRTPMINMVPEDENFIRFCKNPDHYSSFDAVPYIKNSDETNADPYPWIKVDDIVIRVAHYKNVEEACECWNRRRTRITSKRCIVANTWDLHDNMDFINELLAIDLPKVIFTDMQEFRGRKEFIVLDDKVYYKDQRGKVRPNIAEFNWRTHTWRFEQEFPSIYAWLKSI